MQTISEELRLFTSEELQSAVQELFSDPQFLAGMENFVPAALNQYLLENFRNVKTVENFQTLLILPFLNLIQEQSMSNLTLSGVEGLDKTEKYLFISNHRDIGMDSAFMNKLLHEHGFTTCQMAVGDNLMKHRLAELIFLINKSFAVKRSGGPRELYAHSLKLSHYIYQLITTQKDNVWMAQREGRAKDGNDKTQIGVLKMLSMSKIEDLPTHFENLKIVPTSISYELDACDFLKTKEYVERQLNPDYKKTFEEDLASILQGIKGQKGHVHVDFGQPLTNLSALKELKPKAQFEALARRIDESIHKGYRLHAINYVAYDLLTNASTYKDHYSFEEKENYIAYFKKQLARIPEEQKALAKDYLLGIYANPIKNKRAY